MQLSDLKRSETKCIRWLDVIKGVNEETGGVDWRSKYWSLKGPRCGYQSEFLKQVFPCGY